jgi:hypothetical protein
MNAHSILVGKPERMIPLGRPRCGWVEEIKMVVRNIECGGVDWIDLAHDREVESSCEDGNQPCVPWNAR